jgi:hypothetical protein
MDAQPTLLPAESWLDQAAAWLRARAWILGWWACGRAVVLATALVAHRVGLSGYLGHDERTNPLGFLSGWDGRWYRMIASDGYLLVPGHQSDPAFFPLYAILIRFVHGLGFGYPTAGLLLSNGALLATLVAFEALTRELLGPSLARRATIYVAIFPLGYVFSMSYPESLVLGAIALAGLAAIRGRWSTAAICAAVAALARPEGLFVMLPILASAWSQRERTSPVRRGLALGAVLAPVAAFASFPASLASVVHDPLAWSHAQKAWGRSFSPLGFVHAFTHLPAMFAQDIWVVRDVAFFFVYLVLLAAAVRAGTPRPWLIGGVAVVVLPLFSGAFTSIGRFGLLVPPLFWGLAWLGRHRGADGAIRVVSIVLLAAATATIPYIFP